MRAPVPAGGGGVRQTRPLFDKNVWLRATGFGALDVWFAASGFILPTERDQWLDLATLVVFTIAMLVFAVLEHRLNRLFERRGIADVMVPAMTVVAAFASLLPITYGYGTSLAIAVVTGVSLAWLMLRSGAELCRTHQDVLLTQVVLSFIWMLVFHAFLSVLSDELAVVARGAFPLVSGALLYVLSAEGFANPLDEDTAPPERRTALFIRLLIAINALSLVVNLVYNLYRFSSGFDFNSSRYLMIVLQMVFLIALLVVDSVRGMTGRALYATTCAVIVLSCLLFPVHGLDSLIPFGVLFMGFVALDALSVYMTVRVASASGVRPVTAFALIQGSFLGLQIVFARSSGPLLTPMVAANERVLSLVTLLGVALVGLTYFVLLNDRMVFRALPGELPGSVAVPPIFGVGETAGRSDAGAADVVGAPPADMRVAGGASSNESARWEVFSNTHALTAREREVLYLFYKGRSYVRIQEMLGISRGTVNTHMASCYRKLGVASRQELIDLFEDENGTSRLD